MDNVSPTEEAVILRLFSWVDYLVFGVMLLCSALIGVYFACFAKQKQDTTSEYLMGGKTMGIFPISMSLIASYISGITLLGMPAEIYIYGTQYWMVVFSHLVVSVVMAGVYLPVFYTLQITSTYEYLNLRFDRTVRLMGTIIFLIKMLLYIPIVIYVPALAFNQVTGINLHLVTPIVCVICIFYTTVGGIKAVVWTDTLQTILMFGGVITVMILGTIKVGGFSQVIQRSRDSNRLEFFILDLDPTIRHTFWSVFVGNYFTWLAECSVNQAMVQRCLAMSTIKKANITVAMMSAGIFCMVSISCYMGLVIYAMFHDCDPITTKAIGKPDQLLPYFVMEISQKVPGLPGLFVAGVFSAALSSMSTGLNSMTGVIYEDLIRPMVKRPISEKQASNIMKVMVVIIGAVCVALVFLVEHLGTIIQAGESLSGITSGSLLGVFTLGMLFPWTNSKGALAGGIASLIFVGWISLGTQAAVAKKLITFPKKPVSTDGCPAHLWNNTIPTTRPVVDTPEVFALYQMSYLWYTLMGVLTTIIVGLIVSFATGPRDTGSVDRNLLSPVIHRFLNDKLPEKVKLKKISTVNNQTQCE